LCQKRVPSLKELEHAEWLNDDGGGMAYRNDDGKTIHYVKGLTAKVMLERAKKLKRSPLLLHFRIASEGPEVDELAHPFPVSKDVPEDLEGDAEMVLAHNGTWTGWRDEVLRHALVLRVPVPAGPWSDSRAMAWLAAYMGIGYLQLLLQDKSGGCEAGKIAFFSSTQLIAHPFKEWVVKNGWIQSRDLGDFNKEEKREEKKAMDVKLITTLGPSWQAPTPTELGVDAEDSYEELKKSLSSLSETDKIKLFTKGDVEEIISDMRVKQLFVSI
jgi:hypothetical protein